MQGFKPTYAFAKQQDHGHHSAAMLALTAVLSVFIYFANSATAAPIDTLQYKIIKSVAMPSGCFTQGFLIHKQTFYLSCGRYGQSSLRQVSLTGQLLRSVDLPNNVFAEGLTIINNQIHISTWKSGKVFVYDLDNFSPQGSYTIDQEIWGFSHNKANDSYLIIGDGSHTLKRINRKNLDIIDDLAIIDTMQQPVTALNELEIVGDSIWANIWQSPHIIVMKKQWHTVQQPFARLDLSALIKQRPSADGEHVLNGIAYDKDSDCLWITGKHWDRAYALSIEQPQSVLEISQHRMRCEDSPDAEAAAPGDKESL